MWPSRQRRFRGERCNDRLKEAGFQPIEAWPSCFWHDKLKLMLSVCVDDFKLAGPKKSLSAGWSLLRKNIQMEDPLRCSFISVAFIVGLRATLKDKAE